MARKISVEIVGDSANLERAFRRSSQGAKSFEHDIGRASRGAIAASLSFHGLGRSVAFASSSFLGGAGIVFALKSTIAAAEEHQRVIGQTRVAVARSGLSWASYGKQIDEVAVKTSNLSGFDDERLLGTFAKLLRTTGSVSTAMKDNALAADVARGANIDLETAAKIVSRAQIGQARGLAGIGIAAKKGATGVQLIDLITRKYAGSAVAFGRTAVGAQDRFRVAIENTQEALGKGALPVITTYLNRASDWLNKSKNQERVQRDVTSAVKDAGTAIHDLSAIVRTVTGAFGGFKNTAELLGGVIGALKLAKLASGLYDVGLKAKVASGEVSALRGRLLALSRVGPIAIVIAVSLIPKSKGGQSILDKAGLGFLGKGPTGGLFQQDARFADWVRGQIGLPQWGAKSNGLTGPATKAQPDRTNLSSPLAVEVLRGMGVNAKIGGGKVNWDVTSAGGGGGAGAKGGAGLDRASAIALAAAQARLAASRGDKGAQVALVKALKDQIDFDRKYERIQEGLIARGVGDLKGHAATLGRLRGDEAGALDEIAGIGQAASDKRVAAAKAANKSIAARVQKMFEHARAVNVRQAALNQQHQYMALGFTRSGADRAPTLKALRSELGTVASTFKGTVLDTAANRTQLQRVRAVLNGEFKKLTYDTKMRIKEMLDALNPAGKGGPQTRWHAVSTAALTAGLGLSRGERLAVEGRIAGAHLTSASAARVRAGATVIHSHLYLDGKEIAVSTTTHQQKDAKRRSTQTRGPYAGSRVQ